MTVSIAVEFLDAGRIGPPLEARGEPLQVTGRLAFARGSITQEGRTIALWSGVCRHVARAKAMARKEDGVAAGTRPRRRPCRRASSFCQGQRLFAPHRPVLRAQGDGRRVADPADPAAHVQLGRRAAWRLHDELRRSGGHARGGAHHRHGARARWRSPPSSSPPATPRRRSRTRVEVPRHGKSLAFLRGLLEQNGRTLLSYSATIKLRQGQPFLSGRWRTSRIQALAARDEIISHRATPQSDLAARPPARRRGALRGSNISRRRRTLGRSSALAARSTASAIWRSDGRADHARRALQAMGGAGDGGEVVGALDLALGGAGGVEELALDLGQGARDRRRTARRACRGRRLGRRLGHAAAPFSQTSRVALSCSMPIGLVMNPSMPTARLFCSCSSSVLAVTARIGVRGRRSAASLCADAPRQLEAVHGRHLQVGQHEVVAALAPQLERLLAAGRRIGRGAGQLELARQDLAVDRVVVDHQHTAAAVALHAMRPTAAGAAGAAPAGGAGHGADQRIAPPRPRQAAQAPAAVAGRRPGRLSRSAPSMRMPVKPAPGIDSATWRAGILEIAGDRAGLVGIGQGQRQRQSMQRSLARRRRRQRPRPSRTVTMKVEPMPGSLKTSTPPCMASARRRTMDRPSPVPPKRRVVELSACTKGWNRRLLLLVGEADAGVGHLDAQHRVAGASPATAAPIPSR